MTYAEKPKLTQSQFLWTVMAITMDENLLVELREKFIKESDKL